MSRSRPLQPGDLVWAHHLPSKKDRPLVVLCHLGRNGYLLMNISSKPHHQGPRYQYHLSYSLQYEPDAPAQTPLLKTIHPLGSLNPQEPDRKWNDLLAAGVPQNVRNHINLRTYDPCFIKLDDVVHVPQVKHYLTSLRPSDFQHLLNTFNSIIMPNVTNVGSGGRKGGGGDGGGAGAGSRDGSGSGAGSGNGGGSVQKGSDNVEKADEKTWTLVRGRRRPDDSNVNRDDDIDEDDEDDENDAEQDETPFLLSMIQAAGLDPYSYLVQTALHQPPTFCRPSQTLSPTWNQALSPTWHQDEVYAPNEQLSELFTSTSISTSTSEPALTTTSTSERSKISDEPRSPTSPSKPTNSARLLPRTPSPSKELELDPPPTPSPEQALRHRDTLSTAEYSAVRVKRQAVQHIRQLLKYKEWSEQTIKSLQQHVRHLSFSSTTAQGSSDQQLQMEGGDATARGVQFDAHVQRLQELFPDAPGGPSS